MNKDMEKRVTKATESRIKRMKKEGCCNGEQALVVWVFDEMRCRIGALGMSVEEIEAVGEMLPNETEMHGALWLEEVMWGLSHRYPEFIGYTNTHGMNVLYIRDFNALVRAVA